MFVGPLLHYGWLSGHADSVLTGLLPVPNQGANWWRLASDERFWQDAAQTLRFAGVSVGAELILALGLPCCLINAGEGGAVRAMVLIPWALPTTVMALGGDGSSTPPMAH